MTSATARGGLTAKIRMLWGPRPQDEGLPGSSRPLALTPEAKLLKRCLPSRSGSTRPRRRSGKVTRDRILGLNGAPGPLCWGRYAEALARDGERAVEYPHTLPLAWCARHGGLMARVESPVEEVLVVPRSDLFALSGGQVHGFVAGNGETFLRAVQARGRFVPRPDAERDPSLKQIIPYGVLLHGGAAFLLRRSRQGSEARLHQMVSLGVGGHVNPEDLPPDPRGPGAYREAVERAFQREVAEEVVIDGSYSASVAGVLNDDSNSVGSVHFGMVYIVHLADRRIRVRERELLEGEFVTLAALKARRASMETWSAILVDHLSAIAGQEPIP